MFVLQLLSASKFLYNYRYFILAGIAAVLVLIAMTFTPDIAGFFGMETKASLKQKLIQEKRNLEEAVRVADTLKEHIEKQILSTQIVENIIETADGDKDTLSDEVVTIEDKLARVVTAENKKTYDVVKVAAQSKVTSRYSKEMSDKIAVSSIDAIWDTYKVVTRVL